MMRPSAVIDSLEFARTSQELQGQVAVAQLERLADSVFDNRGSLKFLVRGGYDARHRPRLKLAVEGEINLKCQRCLGSLPYPVTVETSLLVLVGKDPAETVEIDDLDGVPADPHTDVWALVEDEMLLAIPYAARHPEGQCSTVIKTTGDGAASPFAVLAGLKRDRVRN